VTDPTVPVLNVGASGPDLTRQLCDIESVSGDERRIADAREAALSAFDHREVLRDADAVVAGTKGGVAVALTLAAELNDPAIDVTCIFCELGIPAVNCGPGNPLRAHADHECAATSEIVACEQGLRAWLTIH